MSKLERYQEGHEKLCRFIEDNHGKFNNTAMEYLLDARAEMSLEIKLLKIKEEQEKNEPSS